MDIEVNWTLILGGVIAAVVLLGKGGSIVDAGKAFLKALSGGTTVPVALPGQAAVAASLPSVSDRVEAAKLLQDYFSAIGCKEGSAAMNTAFDHLLDDHKHHEK